RIISGGADYLIRLYDSADGKELRRFAGHVDAVLDLAFVDNRSFLSVSTDGTIRLWDVGEQTCRQRTALQGSPKDLVGLAFGPPGALLVGWTADGQIPVWTPATGRRRIEWRLPGRVNRVVVAPDSRHVVSANANGTLYVFRLPPEEPAGS